MGGFGVTHLGAVAPGSCIPLDNGCGGGLWGGTCGVVNAGGAPQGTTPDGMWVQYFQISLGNTSCYRAQVRTECVALSRLSLGGLHEPDGEAIFRKALKAMTSTENIAATCRTGRGAVPFRVPMPSSMSGELAGESTDLVREPHGVNFISDDSCQVVSQL